MSCKNCGKKAITDKCTFHDGFLMCARCKLSPRRCSCRPEYDFILHVPKPPIWSCCNKPEKYPGCINNNSHEPRVSRENLLKTIVHDVVTIFQNESETYKMIMKQEELIVKWANEIVEEAFAAVKAEKMATRFKSINDENIIIDDYVLQIGILKKYTEYVYKQSCQNWKHMVEKNIQIERAHV